MWRFLNVLFLAFPSNLKFHAATFSCLSIHEIQSLAPQLSKNTCSAYTLPPYWFVQVEFWDDRKVCSIISYLSVNTVLYCQLSSNWKKMFHTFLSFFFLVIYNRRLNLVLLIPRWPEACLSIFNISKARTQSIKNLHAKKKKKKNLHVKIVSEKLIFHKEIDVHCSVFSSLEMKNSYIGTLLICFIAIYFHTEVIFHFFLR